MLLSRPPLQNALKPSLPGYRLSLVAHRADVHCGQQSAESKRGRPTSYPPVCNGFFLEGPGPGPGPELAAHTPDEPAVYRPAPVCRAVSQDARQTARSCHPSPCRSLGTRSPFTRSALDHQKSPHRRGYRGQSGRFCVRLPSEATTQTLAGARRVLLKNDPPHRQDPCCLRPLDESCRTWPVFVRRMPALLSTTGGFPYVMCCGCGDSGPSRPRRAAQRPHVGNIVADVTHDNPAAC